MPQEFHAAHYDVRAMDLRSRKIIKDNNISGGEYGADFILTENQRDLRFGRYDTLLRNVNGDHDFLTEYNIFPNFLVVFWAAARTDGFVPTRLIGMADPDTYLSFQENRIVVSPDNSWLNSREHAIIVAAALSLLYEKL